MAAKHILACSDLSEHSKRAIRHAAEHASTSGGKVTLIHVSDPQTFVPPQAVLEPRAVIPDEEVLKAQLDELRNELLSGLDVEIAVIADHAPARAICDYANEHGVDLIVVGSHGRGGFERWLIGSVAERIVRHAHCNVFVVRE